MAFVADPVHGLSLGGLVFVENGETVVHTDPVSGETYRINVVSPDTTWGNPKPVTAVLVSMMTNGSLVRHLHDDNRDQTVAVTVEASGAFALAAAEVALMAVIGRPVELVWQPPSPDSAQTVFDVVWSQLDHKMDDFAERYLRRSYAISLQALPYGRSATKTTVPAVATAAPTVVDSGASTSNWSAPAPSSVLSTSGGAVISTYDPSVPWGDYYGTRLVRAFPAPLDVSAERYVAVDWKSSLPCVYALNIDNNPYVNQAEVRREPAPTAGYTRSWFALPAGATSIGTLWFGIIHPAGSGSATLRIDQVLKAVTLPDSGTGRQKTRTIVPGGSVPAMGTVKVEHPSSGLGKTVVFTHPVRDGYSPPLRPWLTSSATVSANAYCVSGAYNSIATDTVFQVPVSAVPQGDVQLWALLNKATTGGTMRIAWAASTAIGGASIDLDTNQHGSTDCFFPAGDTWYLFHLGRLTLPTIAVGADGQVAIAILREGSGDVFLDEAWIFAMDEGCLTVVDCGGGTPASPGPANRLRVAAPSLQDPNGSIMVGTKPDWSDSYSPVSGKCLCDQSEHRFAPDGSMIFTATTHVTDPAVSFEFYRSGHTHAVS